MSQTPVSFMVLVALFILIAIRTLLAYIDEYRFHQFAALHGAEPPPHETRSWIPWGIGPLVRTMNALKLGLDMFDDVIGPRFAETGPQPLGCTTFISDGLLGSQQIETIDPKIVQTILVTKFEDWEQGDIRHRQFGVLLGKSIFTSDGADWLRFRALFRPQFNWSNVNHMEETETSVQQLLSIISKSQYGNEQVSTDDLESWTDVVDLLPLIFRFTTDTSTAFLFGESVGCQIAGAKRDKQVRHGEGTKIAADLDNDGLSFFDAYSLSLHWLGDRIRMQSLYWLIDSPRYRRAKSKVQTFAMYYVKNALRRRMERSAIPNESVEKGSRTHEFNLLDAVSEQMQDPVELRNQLLGLLTAARDTTACMICWLFLLLAQHPDKFEKLRESILLAFGDSRSAAANSPLDANILKSCRYLQYCLNEALRLYPVVPINQRWAVRNTVLPTGGGLNGDKPFAVRKGQAINFYMYTMQRREDIWASDAAKFRPERWENRKIDWSFVPFSSGPRICLGQHYALTEAGYLTARICQQFDQMDWCGPMGKPKKAFGITISPADGVKVRLRRARQEN